ncbi:hypothetical protein SK128_009981 [Halocaridina rubra]|uniref:H15 domain-containing protein n=1 Tax=Halocaridina rubra TaxID=373956 RepID=A0AAN8ZS92_HALRR
MADTAEAPAATPKKGAKKATKAKKAVPKPAHPPYGTMIAAAVKALKERSGSSRQAILKYIVANYKVGDEKKAASRLKIALKKGVTSGALKQVKGSGASGSFKIAKDEAPVKKPVAKKAKKAKAATPKKAKKPAAVKKAKKPAAKKAKKPAAKKAAKKPAAKKAGKKPAKK